MKMIPLGSKAARGNTRHSIKLVTLHTLKFASGKRDSSGNFSIYFFILFCLLDNNNKQLSLVPYPSHPTGEGRGKEGMDVGM